MEEVNPYIDIEENLSPKEALYNAIEDAYNFVDQDFLNLINRKLNRVSAGVIRLLIDKVGKKDIFETVIKDFDNQKYVVGNNYVKKIEIGDGGQFEESIFAMGSVDLTRVLSHVAEIVAQYEDNKDVVQCCANVKNIVLRPSKIPSFIEVRDPFHAGECYEFIIKNIEGRDYEIINDSCPYILECTILNGEEQRIVLNLQDQQNIAKKINQKVATILNQEDFEKAPITKLTKDKDLRLKFIDDLAQQVCKLPSCVSSVKKDGVNKVVINGEDCLYIILKNKIIRVSHNHDSEDISSRLSDRFLLLEASDKINEAFNVISEHALNLIECCEKAWKLSKLENVPDFIVSGEEGDEFLLIVIDDVYFSINFDEEGRPAVYHLDDADVGEEDEAFFLLTPSQVGFFVSELQELIDQVEVA